MPGFGVLCQVLFVDSVVAQDPVGSDQGHVVGVLMVLAEVWGMWVQVHRMWGRLDVGQGLAVWPEACPAGPARESPPWLVLFPGLVCVQQNRCVHYEAVLYLWYLLGEYQSCAAHPLLVPFHWFCGSSWFYLWLDASLCG